MSARGLLRNGDYLKLLTGQTVSGLGSSMSSFVLLLIAMAMTGSPTKAGFVGTAYALGGTLMALPGGALADRISRRRQAGVPASVIGLLETGLGVGGIAGAIAAPKLLARFSTGRLAITSSWVTAFTFTATAFTRQPAVLVALLCAAILLLPAFNSGLFGYQMLITPDSFQGRAQSAIGFLATSTNPLAPVLAGVLLTALGARPTLLFFGGLLVLSAVMLTVSRSIRGIPMLSALTEHAAA